MIVFILPSTYKKVFRGDEPIETLTCSIGSDISQLPTGARIRAERENHRFVNLSDNDKKMELDHLEMLKQVFIVCVCIFYKLIFFFHIIILIINNAI